eukprot:6212453-Pleurochrysis_carterae.AAC.1
MTTSSKTAASCSTQTAKCRKAEERQKRKAKSGVVCLVSRRERVATKQATRLTPTLAAQLRAHKLTHVLLFGKAPAHKGAGECAQRTRVCAYVK